MQFPLARFQLALASAALLTLAACSGGSSPAATTATTTTTTATTTAEVANISGVVADGLIKGASACYDLNDNGICDAGEPVSNATDALGAYVISVPAAEAGKHNLLVSVPATAIDSDNPTVPVGTPFTLRAPPQADTTKPVFVSPVTTIVTDVMAASGTKDPASAIELVRAQLGMSLSPLDNFIDKGANGTPAEKTDAARVKSIAQVVTQLNQQVANTADAGGVSAADKKTLISFVVLNNLNTVVTQVDNNNGTNTSTVADLAKAVLSSSGLSTTTVVAQAAAAKQVASSTPVVATATPTPFVTLRDFRYTDANNYFVRLYEGNDIADADGFKYANEIRQRKVGGQVVSGARNQAFWDATAGNWFTCPADGWQINKYKLPTATATGSSSLCRGYSDTNQRSVRDISGSKISDIVKEIRAYPLKDGASTYSTWGVPDSLPAIAGLTFPAGAELQFNVATANVVDVMIFQNSNGSINKYRAPTATGQTFSIWPFAATLDAVVANWPGDLGNGQFISSNTTIANGFGTIFADELDDFTVTDTATYKTRKRYRVAFLPSTGTAGTARFYNCNVLQSNNGDANCVKNFDTTYTVETRADSRLLKFVGYPLGLEAAQTQRFQPVERAGAVFPGYRFIATVAYSVRMNKTAWDTLRTALGLPVHVSPSAPVPVEAASWLRDIRENIDGSSSYRLLKSTGSGTGTTNEIRKFTSSMGTSLPWYRNTLFLNGSAWDEACPNNGINIGTFSSSPRSSTSCNGLFTDTSTGFDVDISFRNMASVFAEIRLFSGRDGSSDYSNYGPTPGAGNAFLNTTNFPAGSTMRYQVVTNTGTTDNISVPNRVDNNSPAGSVLNTNDAVGVPPTPSTTLPYTSWNFATTLANMVAAYSGDFVAGQALDGVTTLGIYSYFPTPNTNTNPLYTGQRRIRVAFLGTATAGAVRYYLCDQLASSSNTTNCAQTGTGTYAVAPSGNKNVLRFTNLPSDLDTVGAFERIFVENAGSVYFGGRGLIGRKNQSIRLNETAYNAFFSAVSQTPPTVTCTVTPCP